MSYISMQPRPRAARFTVEREALLPVVSALAKLIVERRNTVPILSNVMLSTEAGGVTLYATDLDMTATAFVPADVDAMGSPFTVDAALFADLVRAADKGALIHVECTPGEPVTVAYGRAVHRLAVLPADDMPFLSWRDLEPVAVDADQLHADLSRLAPFMGKEQVRYYLCGIEAADVGGALALSATNGTRLARITRAMPDGLQALAPLASTILPAKLVKVAAKLAKGAGRAALAIGGDRVRIVLDGITLESKTVDGTYPDLGAVLARADSAQAVALTGQA